MTVRGFVMTELLIALLVLAVSVSAALALALDGFGATAEARRAEIAAGLAADLAGRTRALQGVDWSALPAPAPCGAACTPEQLAAAELAAWYDSVAATLPSGAGLLVAGGGSLAVTLTWAESGGVHRELRLGIAQ